MTHFRVLYIGQDPDADFAPFSEVDENTYRPVDRTKELRADYKQYGKEYRKKGYKNMVEFACHWFGEMLLLDKAVLNEPMLKAKIARCNANKDRYVLANGSRLIKVVDFYNPDCKYDYYSLEENITSKFDHKALIAEAEERRRDYHRKAVEVLGHIPKFTSFDEIADEEEKNGAEDRIEAYQRAGDRYHEQPDVKALEDADLYADETARCSEEEYVAKASLPFCAIVTDKGWFEQERTGWWGSSGPKQMTDEEWRALQMKVIEDALKDRDEFTEVWVCDCHI